MEAKQLRHSAEEIANRLEKPQQTKDGWLACCPAHPDKSPSLSIKDGDKGFPVFYCYAGCTYEAIAAALGISSESPPPPPAPSPKPKPEAEWEAAYRAKYSEPVAEAPPDHLLTGWQLAISPDFYHQPWSKYSKGATQYFSYFDANREIWATVKRVDVPGQPKKIQPTTMLPDGPRPLYLLPQLLAQSELGGGVLVVEGEKTVLGALFYEDKWAVTTSIGGAAAPHKTDWSPVENRAVVIWPDHDEPGQKYAETVAELCREAGASSISVVQVPEEWPEKWDLADLLPEGATADTIDELMLDARPWPDDGFELLSDLFKAPDTPTEWVLDKLFPVGATSILGARPGAGKSSIARNLAMCVADGLPFLGRGVKQGRVMVAALEENRKMVIKAFRTMGATGNNLYLRSLDMTEDGLETLRSAIKRIDPVLITIDTLGDFFMGQDVNEHKIMKPALAKLHRLAEATGVHIHIVHHDKKEDTGPDSLLGSVAIGGGVDSSWLLDWNFDTDERVLRTLKQRYPDGESMPKTIIGLDKATYRITDLGPKSDAVRKGVEESIIDVLTGLDEPMKRVPLLEAVGVRRDTAIKALHKLIDVMKVDEIKEGRALSYQLHIAGK